MSLRRGLTLVLLLVMSCLVPARTVSGQEPGYDSTDGCSGAWQRQFGINVLVLDCQPGFATEKDRAYMYPRAPITPSEDWRSQLNFEDAVWLFDAGVRGKASLIIDFRSDGSTLVAELFDDVDGDGEVRYGLERGYPKSVESRFPSFRVAAPDGWWVRDGKVNYNLTVSVDGPYLEPTLNPYARHDGRPETITRVADPTGAGRPRWQMTQVTLPLSAVAAYPRTILIENRANDEGTPSTYVLWPYLGYTGPVLPEPSPPLRPPLSSLRGASYGWTKRYNQHFPPIQVNWKEARIQTLGQFVGSHLPNAWWVNSLLRFGEGELTVANFENPFAFYDLAGANDGYPDLEVRIEHWIAGDPFPDTDTSAPRMDVRYTWDQTHEHNWTYALQLFGRKPLLELVEVGPFKVQSLSFETFPRWVIDNPWDAAAFVAAERDYWTSEGIYEGCLDCQPAFSAYRAGRTATPPHEQFDRIGQGMRGEYTFYLNEPPRIYLSAVDRKVHLYRAERGVWAIGETENMRYSALGDEYIRRWDHTLDGAIIESLVHLSDRVIYSDASGVWFARAPADAAVFVAQPPADGDSWRRLRAQLAGATPKGEGYDLGTIFGWFEQDTMFLPNASIWDVRPTESGFTFVLRLTENVAGVDWLSGFGAGTYAGSYSAPEGFSARPWRPAQLSLGGVQAKGETPTELVPIRLAAELRNVGDEGATGVPVTFFAARPSQVGVPVAWTIVDVSPGEMLSVETVWNAPDTGEWDVWAAVAGPAGAASPKIRMTVRSAPPADVGSLMLAQGLRPLYGGAVTASLTLAVGVAAGLALVIWRAGDRARRGDVDR